MFFAINDVEQWNLFPAVDNTVVGIVSKSGGTVSGKFCAGAVTCSRQLLSWSWCLLQVLPFGSFIT